MLGVMVNDDTVREILGVFKNVPVPVTLEHPDDGHLVAAEPGEPAVTQLVGGTRLPGHRQALG